ncbi:MAG TPA: ParB/RepB/Spo0J family partition protein [Steroidobacteraceae bacterium]|nr:ParB/RepB/Spo0J family partition protein [Steroidobacteraceae bacterium]
MSDKKRGLGRGLEALLGQTTTRPMPGVPPARDQLAHLPVDLLQRGAYQPRQDMREESLSELADSIRAQGIVQPIVVRPVGMPGPGESQRYEIIAGERRWRAATQAGLTDIPVVLREVDDRAVIAMALIENIQREDLNPLEEAQALSRLIDEFSLTHQQAAEAVGRSRAAVSNLLRLLELPDGIRKLLEDKSLEMGHARALLTLAPAAALSLALEAVAEGWSVREVERRAQMLGKGQIPGRKPAKPNGKKVDADIAALERELSEKLSAKVAVQHGRGGRGKLVISYHGLDTLDGILERLRRGD